MNDLLLRRRELIETTKGEPQEPDYLTFTALQAESTVKLYNVSSTTLTRTYEYRKSGEDWISYTIGDDITLANVGDTVQFRNASDTVYTAISDWAKYRSFGMSGKIAVSGNIMSLLDKTVRSTRVGANAFLSLFTGTGCSTSLIEAHDLILPSTNPGSYAYYNLFSNCRALTTLPPEIPALTAPSSLLRACFNSCTSVYATPYIRVTSIASTSNGFLEIYKGNAGKIKHMGTCGGTGSMFQSDSITEVFIVDDTVPPTLASNSISSMRSGARIYVPDDYVEDYKIAQYWSNRASYIKGLSEIYSEYLQDGLVLHLDAKKPGNTSGKWTDLVSGRELTTSNVIFNTDNVQFNGTNSSISFDPTSSPIYTTPLTSACTIECVFDDTSDGESNRSIYMPSSSGEAALYMSDDKIITGTTSGSMGDYIRVPKGSISITNGYGFWNGRTLARLTTSSETNAYDSQNVYIGSSSNSAVFQGKLYSIRVYNRVLSKREMLYNYQIDRARFSSLFE